MRARWNEKSGERHTGFLFGTVLERGVTSLFLASERAGEREGAIQSEREGERECEGEIEEVWFSSTQLVTATAVTSLHLLLLSLSSSIPSFLPSFSPYFISHSPLAACRISLDSRPCNKT